ncbi:hypothetical protein BH09PAT2_BH09PAT2_08980 [soil metagenome]
MTPFRRLKDIDNSSFYCEVHPLAKAGSFFIRGDLIVLLPFLVLILCIGLFSIRFMLIVFGVYVAIRELGELIFWLLQQFGHKNYRPHDFGFKQIDNNAIYILYQTFAISGVVVGISITLFAILYL